MPSKKGEHLSRLRLHRCLQDLDEGIVVFVDRLAAERLMRAEVRQASIFNGNDTGNGITPLCRQLLVGEVAEARTDDDLWIRCMKPGSQLRMCSSDTRRGFASLGCRSGVSRGY